MVKLIIRRKYPFVQISDEKAARQVAAMRTENDQLRSRLIASQQDKVFAITQSEEIRQQKERLRERLRSLTKELRAVRKTNDELQAAIRSLKEENASLRR